MPGISFPSGSSVVVDTSVGPIGHEDDLRHFLYRHYLSPIDEFRPAEFVMENVKGILSSKVDGTPIFPRKLEDLRSPRGRRGSHEIIPLILSQGVSGYGRFEYVQVLGDVAVNRGKLAS